MTIWHWLVLIIVGVILFGAIWTSKKVAASTTSQSPGSKPIAAPGTGVGGWLALLVLGLVLLGPLRAVTQLSDALSATEVATPQLVAHPIWESYKTWAWAIVISAAALSIFTGARLVVSREASVVKYAIISLWICGPLAAVALGVVLPFWAFSEYMTVQDFMADKELQLGILVSVGVTVLWTVYLTNSKRVRDTYILNRSA
jgi:hypothetical protein